jgi:hypothetical protein
MKNWIDYTALRIPYRINLGEARKLLKKTKNFNKYPELKQRMSFGKDWVEKLTAAPPVPDTKDIDVAFGNVDILPTRQHIPNAFRHHRSIWHEITEQWFYRGMGDSVSFYPKEGIDAEKAFKTLQGIMRSWAPKHEDKMEGVAYLMSLWFDRVENWKKE